ncbi:MAG: EAL domain-containing protein [Sulfuritalea sp.]|nr:EAL domain-containing protein [Sulfuritalea sp.]
MSYYSLKLILLSLLIGSLTILLAFNLVTKLYKSATNEIIPLFIFSTTAVGTGLWLSHALVLLSAQASSLNTYISIDIAYSWGFSLITSAIVLYISSKKTLPIHSLMSAGVSAAVSTGLAAYYLIQSFQNADAVALSPLSYLLAALVATAITSMAIMIIFWFKSYAGQSPLLTKSIFAPIISLAFTGVYMIYTIAIVAPDHLNSNSHVLWDNTLLNITIALSLICIFLVTFILAIFYDKLGYDTFKFNLFKKEDLEEISQLALVDTLTQLPNRRAFMQHLESATKRCERNGLGLAVAFIDVDDFKDINDSLGHQVGDQVLQKIASRLVSAVRGCDEVSRIGGDEFVAIIEGIENTEDYIAVVERMVSSVRAPCVINDIELNLSISVGVAMHANGGSIEDLISAADTAMYSAKKDGKNQFRFFDAEIALVTDQLLEIQYDLKKALANNELQLHYQIKIDSLSKDPVGAEALLRWQHPIKGLLYPADFMHAADRFGLSYAINDWIMEECCSVLHQLNYRYIPFDISINLSQSQIANANFVDDVKLMLKRFDLPASSLMFDCTEANALKNELQFNNQLSAFKKAGIRIAIDDFGTYSSSITNLQHWQVDELKLDHTFTADINTNNQTQGVIQAVIELAHALEMNVVAEGVETEAQRTILASLGCDQMQGYLISRPMPKDRLIKLLKNIKQRLENP